MRAFRVVPVALLTALLALALAGCGDDESTKPSADKSTTAPSKAADPESTATAKATPTPQEAKESASKVDATKDLLTAKQWKELCFFTDAEVAKLAPSLAPYGSRDGKATNFDDDGSPVDLYCGYQSAADTEQMVQVMARPYREAVDFEDGNDFISATVAWEDACDDGDFDCGKLAGGTPYAVFDGTGYATIYVEGPYYYQVAILADPESVKDAEVKALVTALENKIS